ncbi:UDP-N-acetylmuramate--L-alanine ligase [Candidatus Peregrinibacteria bacterium]|nr:UDP-N-acetylmuramate--L-alanine ligase [Candidatus Peregrinibacteria bacterium]
MDAKTAKDMPKEIHIVGIGGIGVSALAGILLRQGKCLSGSDMEASEITDKFKKQGVKIYIGHKKENLAGSTELVIHSLAIPKTNPELIEAKKRHIPIFSYPQAVGQLTKQFWTLAVCGTHGKSTIAAMIAKILIENNFDPTVIVGTKLKELEGENFRLGKSKILVLEACEYMDAFLNYNPRAIILSTLDPDHLDYFKDFEDYKKSFRRFSEKLPSDGSFFGNLDDEDVHEIFQDLQRKKFPAHNMFTYGIKYSHSDFYLNGNQIIRRGVEEGQLNLKIPGEHNRSNALAAFAVCRILFGMAPKNILRSLNNYKGAFRRFEIKGKIGRTVIVDDYGHHPAEISATLQAVKEKFPDKKICVVFQPHQYSRTKKLFNEFGACFALADYVIIPNIYEARDKESDKKSVSSQQLVVEIKRHHKNAFFGNGLKKTTEYLKKNYKKFNVILTMGAGDVWKIAEGIFA